MKQYPRPSDTHPPLSLPQRKPTYHRKGYKYGWVLHLVFVIFLLVGLLFHGGQQDDLLTQEERAWLDDHDGKIRLVETCRSAPIEFINEYGQWVGISNEFIEIIENNLGFKFFRVRDCEFSETLNQLDQGVVDVKCNFEKTASRSGKLLFTEPYISVPNAIIVRREIKGTLSIGKLEGMKIVVVQEHSVYEYLRKHHPGLDVEQVSNALDGLQKVVFYQADAMIINLAVASYYIDSEGLTNLHLAGTIGESNHLSLASSKRHPILNRILIKGLAQITPQEKREILAKWIHLDRSLFVYDFRFWYVFMGIVVSSLVITLFVRLWIRTLKSQVRQKTRELQNELAERKRMERHVLESEKLKAIGTFAGGIAHDFNNTLGTIIGYAEIMEMCDLSPGSRPAQRLNQVLQAAYRAKGLVRQILTFSRQSEQEKMPVIVNPIAQEVMEFLKASLPANIRLRKTCGIKNDLVWADPTQIHRILMNLCTNAAQSMMSGNGGELTVDIVESEGLNGVPPQIPDPRPGPYVVISVRDTGTGMPQEIMAHIFEPFFTTKPDDGGTGMGLAVVHGIIKDLGGTLIVESTVGQGSLFKVFLPQYIGALFSDPKQLDKLELGRKGRLLLVDDNRPLADSAGEILNECGYNVLVCYSGQSAWERFKEAPQSFDLVITDYGMPDTSGSDLAQAIIDLRPDIPIIMCSGYGPIITNSKPAFSGTWKYLQKPIGAYELVRAVREELEAVNNERGE